MHKGRLEAFSDGVIAIVITIMVLEMHVPHGADLASLRPLVPVFSSYVLSFVFVAIYWNNHHHLLQAAKHVDGRVLWSNMALLFWLTLFPFTTNWMGETHFAPLPVFAYGAVLLAAALSYTALVRSLIAVHGRDSTLARAIGDDRKGWISVAAYVLALGVAFVNAWVSCALFVFVAILWLIPDRRIERALPRAEH